MNPPATVWTERFRVRSYEVEPTGDASVTSLCNYLQEAAANHAGDLGFSMEHLAEDRITWVLSRLHLEVNAYPSWRQEVHLTTWPSGRNGIFATRDFLLADDAGRPLARATSAWFLIDIARRRPVRLPAAVQDLDLPDRPRALVDDFSRLPGVDEGVHVLDRKARWSDADLNGHVNNVRYVAWALDSLAADFLESHRLRRLMLHFRAECHPGDEIRVASADDGDGSWLHAVSDAGGHRNLAEARTDWEAR